MEYLYNLIANSFGCVVKAFNFVSIKYNRYMTDIYLQHGFFKTSTFIFIQSCIIVYIIIKFTDIRDIEDDIMRYKIKIYI